MNQTKEKCVMVLQTGQLFLLDNEIYKVLRVSWTRCVKNRKVHIVASHHKTNNKMERIFKHTDIVQVYETEDCIS